MKGDEEGEWTQIGQRGCTTIDYIIKNEEGRDKIQEMAVGNRIKSDHAPLELEVKWEEVRRTQEKRKEEKEESVIRWNTEGIEEYQRKLERSSEARNWKELKEKVADAISRIEVRGQREDCYEEKWWYEECHKRKIVLTKALKEMRSKEISEEEWRKRRKEYINFLEKKKRDKGKEWLRELEKDKGMKMFWKAVSSCKKTGSQVDETITKYTWRDHFRGQYIIKEAAVGTPESNEREEEDVVSVEDITTEEVRETIRKLKEKKAAGQDRITNEAWIIGEELLTAELTTVLNDIWKGGEVPKEWRTGTIKAIFKKKDKREVGNYRGITLMDTEYKIYAEIIRKRLVAELEEKKVLSDTQMGYREG